MANFFAKPKASTSSRAPSNEAAESAIAGPSQAHSEFSKSFKPFVLKKDATLAPINWFVRNKKQRRQHLSSAHANEVITIDCDDEDERICVDMQHCQSTTGQADLSAMSARGSSYNFLKHTAFLKFRNRSSRFYSFYFASFCRTIPACLAKKSFHSVQNS